MTKEMRIGDVARSAGVSVEAIRYYEREGLLPRSPRTHTGYRMFGPEAVSRVNFIRQARDLDLSLDEIKEIFHLSQAGNAPCCRVRELLGDKLGELNRRIRELTRFRDGLEKFFKSLSNVPDQADASEHVCKLIEIAPPSLTAPQLQPAKRLRPEFPKGSRKSPPRRRRQ